MIEYCESKLGDLLLSNEFNSRYSDQGVISVAVDPGLLDTDLFVSPKSPICLVPK
jgi:retinol dehydrogenase 12